MFAVFCRHSIDIIVPEYNELSRQKDAFDERLLYLSDLSKSYNVILVDDASTDGSWERILERSAHLNPRLYLCRMERNGQKVLAIKRALEISDADYVMLTDFDSTIVGPERIPTVLGKFDEDPRLAGIALRLVPEGGSILAKFQDIEYATGQKIFGAYLSSRRMQRCVPGAAGIWRRSTLLKLLDEHSGRHNGDDLEATILALRHGYHTLYDSSIEVRTSVPQGIRQLFAQRRRWELGALETYDKERRFYRRQMKRLKNRLGQITILDVYAWVTLLLSPIYLANLFIHPESAVTYAVFQLVVTGGSIVFARKDLQSKRELLLAPAFPIYQYLALAPRLVALADFVRSARRSARAARVSLWNRLFSDRPFTRSTTSRHAPRLILVATDNHFPTWRVLGPRPTQRSALEAESPTF